MQHMEQYWAYPSKFTAVNFFGVLPSESHSMYSNEFSEKTISHPQEYNVIFTCCCSVISIETELGD